MTFAYLPQTLGGAIVLEGRDELLSRSGLELSFLALEEKLLPGFDVR